MHIKKVVFLFSFFALFFFLGISNSVFAGNAYPITGFFVTYFGGHPMYDISVGNNLLNLTSANLAGLDDDSYTCSGIHISSLTTYYGFYPDILNVFSLPQAPSLTFDGGNGCSLWNSYDIPSSLPDGNYWSKLSLTTGDYLFLVFSVSNSIISISENQVIESCSDGIQNQDETGIDIGGVCQILSSEKIIASLSLTGLTPNVGGVIDEVNHIITLTVPFGTDVATLVPAITISPGASVNPNSNVAQDFSNLVIYTVTGEDGSIQIYTVTVVPSCTIDCFSNVLFLPGMMGSRLFEEGLDCGQDIVGPECGDQELWVSSVGPDQAKLALDNLGKSVNSLYTKDDTQNSGEEEKGIVDEIGGANIYNSFIDDLRNWKQDGTIMDYAFIPYDWRLSLEDIITNGATSVNNNLSYTNTQNFSESFILKKLEALQSSSKSDKVTIIAHSNGGLVAKALIQKLKDTNNPLYDKIDKVIFVAVPQVGTPDAFISLLHGTELGYGFIMDKERSRQLSENMPTVYNLLPSAGYFATVDPTFVIDQLAHFENKPFFNSQISQYGFYVSNQTELRNYILGTDGRSKPSFSDTVHPNIGNSLLYAQAESVHQILDSWQPSPDTKVIQVAGWGEETIAGLNYQTYLNSSGVEYLSYKPNMVVDGDGTVVVPSALWMFTTNPNVERWWVDLKEYNKPILGINRDHPDILEIQNLRDFIKYKITQINNNSVFDDPDDFILNSNLTLTSTASRLHYTLHSPLTLGITDSEGKYTGMDPVTKQIKEEIPDVTYRQIGEVQFLSVPAGTAYTLKLKGYQSGSFSLDVDKQQGNTIIASTSFQGIPVSTSTIATMIVAPNFEVLTSTLNIDQNGDGTMEKILQATQNGVTVYDTTPPELQAIFDINKKDIVFSAQDLSDPHPTLTMSKDSITLKDNAGNITIISFTKIKENATRLKITYNKVTRNGIITKVPNTNIIYSWKEKKGILTDIDTKITIKGVEKYIFSYKKATNTTTIKEKTSKGIIVKTKPRFVVVTVKTNEDSLRVDY